MNDANRNNVCKVRLNDEELRLFQKRSQSHGGNFNQVMHRANELAIDDKLSENYFHKVIMPEAQSTLKAIRGIKAELDTIHERLEKCNTFHS